MGQNCVPQRWSQILVWFQSYFLILCKENVAFTRVKWLYSSCLSISKDCVNSTANVLFSDKDLSFCPFPERKFGKRNYFCFTENSILGSKVFFFHWILLHICLMGFWLSFDRLLSSGLIQNCETPDVPENLGEHGYSSAKSCSGFRGNLILNVLLSPICILCFYFYSSQTLYKGEWQ